MYVLNESEMFLYEILTSINIEISQSPGMYVALCSLVG
jgi:hypothetical protein